MAAADKLFWNRVGHVEIEDQGGDFVSYEGLDFKFDVQTTGSTYSRFSVGICGLSRDTINDLITWPNPESYSHPRHVKVFAGYEDGGESLIAYGGIFSAIPTTPPDVWLNIEACKFLELREPIKGVEASKQKSFQEIFEQVCKIVEMNPGDTSNVSSKVTASDKKYDFAYTGSRELLPMKFADAMGIIVYEKDGTLECCDRDGQYKAPTNPHSVDMNNGLLAVGALEYNKAAVTTRLNNVYSLFDWAHLTSERIPQASTDYWITAVRHTGHLRGNEWQTTLTMIRGQGNR